MIITFIAHLTLLQGTFFVLTYIIYVLCDIRNAIEISKCEFSFLVVTHCKSLSNDQAMVK